ncbi:MAG TPA: AraC family transcriptional regulator, partial [Candidatus Alectryocaccobium stercorigallinarum]|nr:AraC family transcriptional regulator [Candidatus Alectryocaccobium stercorigallinarum]
SFSSQSYFSKIFHAKTGMTPMQYRFMTRNSLANDPSTNIFPEFFSKKFNEKGQNYT